ncbi:hypothetical protein FUA23_07455 [Neolewinella aurantiaca]|uniref:DNA mismatch repair proteins mutS family domain-containing protein n=1 Tax=Neolewinella aurantiaca TaxID=2602767 RepID=A0A5C7FJK8_9BACT|nr:hypothetical protein [Neolewinella aurantiaca]TXF90068.1 hypothetical protein FUA23_07455 [Neolewinella aurantiaca]
MQNPDNFYQQTSIDNAGKAKTLQSCYDRLALVRLVVFIGWLALLIVLFSNNFLIGLAVFVGSLPSVAYGVRWHLNIQKQAEEAAVLAGLAEGELRALEHDFEHFDGGADFLESAHPYAVDLDIFGRQSLFQFINRTVTAPGRSRLADALLGYHDEGQAARTRVQSKDMEASPDWCLRFRTLGHDLNDEIGNFDRLLGWLDRPAVAPTDWTRVLLFIAPVLTLASIAWMLFMTPWQLGVIGFLPAIWLIRKYQEVTAAEHAHTAAMGNLLKTYAALLEHAETRPGGIELTGAPQRALQRLSFLISQLDVRYNPFSILLEVSTLWSLNKLRRLDAWREEHKADLPGWLAALSETDALVSWATLRYNHPEWTDPVFTNEPIVEATGLGHPLLAPGGRITNDFSINTDGHIHLITGSNMAGKSTWLRTVGINLVLANAGGPVCALSGSDESPVTSPGILRTRPNLQVWTSMRTQDDLSESTSSFYAELKRLKAIIEAVSSPDQEVFFLLDEILKGTNSRDRHTGSRALIRQLIRERGAGIIATHDLELGALEAEPGSHVENYAMEVQVSASGDLVFDYKLHPGVCQSFNATALMARMGIDIPDEEIRLHHK